MSTLFGVRCQARLLTYRATLRFAAKKATNHTVEHRKPMDSYYTSYRPGLSGPGILPRHGSTTFVRAYSNLPSSGSSVMNAMWIILGINTAVFATYQYAVYNDDRSLRYRIRENTLVSWAAIKANRYRTLVTSAFTHFELGHFVFNMITLRSFCTLLSWIPGVTGAHVFSLTAGSAIAGSTGFLMHTREHEKFQSGRVYSAVGASGVVMYV